MHHFPAHHSLTHHVFLQLGMAGYHYNGRKKAKMALMTAEKVTCKVLKLITMVDTLFNHVSLYCSSVHGAVGGWQQGTQNICRDIILTLKTLNSWGPPRVQGYR